MKYYLQYGLQLPEGEKREMAIAVLANLGLEGFEETEQGLVATALEGNLAENEIEHWLQEQKISFEKTRLAEKNWNEIWESELQPIVIDDFVSIRASFHPLAKGVQFDIIITPKMSFGTGHHPTTRLMVKMMRSIQFENKTVFDFGTGTGVLAILAKKLGAKRVEATDIDEWSIANALENIEANGVQDIQLWQSDNLKGVKKADIILANINRNIILKFLPELVSLLADNGVLIFSGLLNEDEGIITESIGKFGFLKVEIERLNGWMAICFH